MRFPLLLLLLLVFFIIPGCKKKDVTDQPTLPVYQPIKLTASSFRLGNLETQVKDTFTLHFNKTVTVENILLLDQLCLPELQLTSFNHGRTVQFWGLLCAQLGKDYDFEVQVRDEDGKVLKDTVHFSYYQHRFRTEGQVMNYTITQDNKYIWLCTNNPDRIYQFSLADTSFRKVYDMPFKPFSMAWNERSKEFYIVNYPHYNTNVDRLYVFDPVNGQIKRTITLQKDQYDDPQKNLVIYQLDFGYNGYGVMNTGTKEYGPSRWRVIDTRYNDTIYAHSQWISSIGGVNDPFYEILSVQPNYNRTKLYFRLPYAVPRAGILDITSGQVSLFVYPDNNPNHYLVASKASDQLFIANFTHQSIFGPGSTNNYSQFDNRYSETAEFSYRAGEQNIMYYRGRSDGSYNFNILDYNQAKSILRTNVGPQFNKIQATTDGKYVLALVGNVLTLWESWWFYQSV